MNCTRTVRRSWRTTWQACLNRWGLVIAALAALAAAVNAAEPVWTITEGIGAPSHPLYDPDSNSLFVTQISGVGDEKDGVGVVSRLDLNGNMLDVEWISGLDAPKGIARQGTTLWVSDIDRLHRIDSRTAEIEESLDVPDAKFLVGTAVDSQGTVYVADMLASKIHQYRDKRFAVYVAGDALESPAGLVVAADRLIVAAWGLTDDYTTEVPGRFIAIEKRKSRPISQAVGNLYGLVSDGAKGWLGTDFTTGRVLHVTETKEPRELLRLSKGIGGIEFVTSRQLLIVTEVTENRISAFDLAPMLKSKSQ